MNEDQNRANEPARQAKNGRREQRPSFQFYPQDFLASDSVAQMTHEEVGVYILLLCRAWVGPGLPVELARLARLVGVTENRMSALWTGPLGSCFEIVGGRFVNPRMERERVLLQDLSAKRAKAGSRGGKAASDVKQSEPFAEANRSALLEQSDSKGGGEGRDSDSGSLLEGVQGEPSAIVARVAAKDLEGIPPGILADLDRWAGHRREIGKPLGATAVRGLVAEARKDPAAFTRRVDASILSGTTVFLEDRPHGANGQRLTAREASDERHVAAWDEFINHLNTKDPQCLTPSQSATLSAGSATSPTPLLSARTPPQGGNGSPGSTPR